MSSELWPAERTQGERARVSREVLVAASPSEVWEAIATEAGRERWLDDAAECDVEHELEQEPARLVWWWSPQPDGARTRVEFRVRAVAGGTRVLVTEYAPRLPLQMLARCAVSAMLV